MKHILLFILLIAVALNGHAKFSYVYGKDPDMTPVDTSYIDVIFNYEVTDTILKKTRSFKDVVLIGDSHIKYMSWGSVLADSAWNNIPISERSPVTEKVKNRWHMTRSQFRPHLRYLVIDLKQKSLYNRDFYNATSYYYEEALPEFEWRVNDEISDTIIGYPCKTAECSFRGRHWKVWFSEELPMPYGPWKFHGLPGMILKAEDISGAHKFVAEEIVDNKCQICKYLKEPIDYFRTTRERDLEEHEDYAKNAAAMLVQMGMLSNPVDKDGNPLPLPNRRLLYNPLELE